MSSNISNPGPVGHPGPQGIAGPGISVQIDQTASRAIDGTIYHNTTSGIVMVVVSVVLPSSSAVDFYTQGTALPSIYVSLLHNLNFSSIYVSTTFIVLPGWYYKGTPTGSPVLITWIEYL